MTLWWLVDIRPLPQGLPLGRKLSQFFGRVILIMTSLDFGAGKTEVFSPSGGKPHRHD
jgi:hypothetical protein